MILSYVDYVLDRTTMYRFVLYYLVAILLAAVLLAGFGLLPYSPLAILGAVLTLLLVCGIGNAFFAWAYEVPTNLESPYITALILACILPPLQNLHDLPLLFWAGALAIGSKFILAIRGKHLFNPAAIAVVLTAFWLDQPATWWVGTPYLLPVVLLGGLAMVRKLRRADMELAFFLTALGGGAIFAASGGHDLFRWAQEVLLHSSLLFFAFVMLTEPLTSPTSSRLQVAFGGLVGLLFSPQVHLGSLYITPELALVTGNLFAYAAGPRLRQRLTLVGSHHLTPEVVEFGFRPERPFRFLPGQYMEFTLAHPKTDSRGSRRYLTLASSPTEETVKLGVKFHPEGSSFKRHLLQLQPGQTLLAGQLGGSFTLPKDQSEKLAFLAGGIGVTPFRSMLKYLADSGQSRAVTMLYMERSAEELAYTDLFAEAEAKAGARVVYTLTGSLPGGWKGRSGRIDAQMIKEEIPDFAERTFYVSGPHSMVTAVTEALRQLGIRSERIKKDFFPGLA